MGTRNATRFPELRAWMQRTGTTQQELAALTRVTGAQISRVLGGTRQFSLDTAIKVSLVTAIPVQKLVSGNRAAELLKLLGEQQNRVA